MAKKPYLRAGKVGNVIWQRNRYGQICYERFIPTNPRTAKQQVVRGHWAAVSSRWGRLQQWQRELWKAAGRTQRTRRRLGRSYPLNGYNYFVRENMRRANRGEALVEVPPTTARRRPGAAVGASSPAGHYYGSALVVLWPCYGILSVLRAPWGRAGTVLGGAREAIGGEPSPGFLALSG